MKINMFSGARRLALLLAIFGSIFWGYFVFQQAPDIRYNYRIPDFGTKYVKSDECDISTDATKHLDYKNEDGSSFTVRLCFAASRADDGRMLVPYEQKDGQILMNGPYSTEVRQYVDLFSTYFFKLKHEDFEKAKREYSSEKIWIKLRGVGEIIAGLVVFSLGIAAIGWVVRGFFGIASGSDFRRAD